MNHSLEQFILTNGEDLLRLAFTYVKKHELAEDIVQDVLLKAYEKQDQFNGTASYKTYLYRMVINRCHDYFRSWSYKNTVITEHFSNIFSKPVPPEPDTHSTVGECLLKLPVKYREVLVLYYYKDFTQDAIAQLLSIPISTVKTRMVRGREQLKKMLKEDGFDGTLQHKEEY